VGEEESPAPDIKRSSAGGDSLKEYVTCCRYLERPGGVN